MTDREAIDRRPVGVAATVRCVGGVIITAPQAENQAAEHPHQPKPPAPPIGQFRQRPSNRLQRRPGLWPWALRLMIFHVKISKVHASPPDRRRRDD